MRISDWSSDVCSSDLEDRVRVLDQGVPVLRLYINACVGGRIKLASAHGNDLFFQPYFHAVEGHCARMGIFDVQLRTIGKLPNMADHLRDRLFGPCNSSVDTLPCEQIGRASCRERVCQYV